MPLPIILGTLLLSWEWLRIPHLKIRKEGRKEAVWPAEQGDDRCHRYQWASVFPGFALTWNPAVKVSAGCGSAQGWFQETSATMRIASAHYHRQICHLSLLTGIWKPGTVCGWARTPRVSGGASLEPDTDCRVEGPVFDDGRTLGETHPLHCFAAGLEHDFVFCLNTENLGQIPKKKKEKKKVLV